MCGIIIQEVQAAVSQWESLATLLQIPAREMDMFKEMKYQAYLLHYIMGYSAVSIMSMMV